MTSIYSLKSNDLNSLNVTTNESKDLIKNNFEECNIIYAIEEITNEYSTNKYPVIIETIYELFIIYDRNNQYIVNYYYREDKENNDKENNFKNNKYVLKEIININDLSKTNRIFTFLKNYANYNDDKKLKTIINKKKFE